MEVSYDTGNNSSILPEFDNDPHILDNVYVRVCLILLYTVIFILCCFGNLAVILVVTLHWKMRSITKFCLGNMAFADLSVGIFCIYQNLSTYLLDSWLFGDFMCKMYHFITGLCHTASILILVVVSIERYLVLLHSFKCRRMLTIRNLALTVVGVWVLSAVICLPRLFYFGLIHIPLSDTHSGDICVPKKSMYNSATADTIYFLVLYVIPLGIITILYARIAWYLRQSDRLRINELNGSWNSVQLSNVHFDGETAQIRLNIRPSTGPNNQLNGRLNRGAGDNDAVSSSVSTTSTSGFVYTFRGHWIPEEGVESSTEQIRRRRSFRVLWKSSYQQNSRQRRYSDSTEGPHHTYTNGCANPLARSVVRVSIPRNSNGRCGNNNNEVGLDAVWEGTPKTNTARTIQVNRTASAGASSNGTPATTPNQRNLRSSENFCRYSRIQLSHIRRKQRHSVVRMLIVIVMTFAVLNLPFHVRKLCINYLPSFDMSSDVNNVIAPLTFLLMYSNCAINPILYAFLSKHFRDSFWDLLHCRRRRSSTTRNNNHLP